MNKQQDKALSVQDVAKLAGVERKTVQFWINEGKLPAYKLPGRGERAIVRVKPDALANFLKSYDARRPRL